MNPPPQSNGPPVIPDHQLVRRIGQGSYGEIWLARNVIGTYRAVKIVYRSRFDDSKPFDREFTGLQAFEPVSRSHPGLVNILQVGRNEDMGCMYYVMELADDEVAGRQVHPDVYVAMTLGRQLSARERLPANECVQIGIHLAAALGHLHKAGLVHRDIKPSNIIFVNGQPKLADIGLVSLANAPTFVGSEGYIPPEGPGSFQADIYSLGKVLYEISTGQDRQRFPELPRNISTFDDCADVAELNEVVVKACAQKPADRYSSADDLRADLEMISAGRSVKRLHFVERQLARVRRVAAAAIGITVAVGVLAYAINRGRNREKQLLAASYVARGAERVADGNPHAAVPWFAEALRLQQSDASIAESHRLRIGAAFQQAPKLLQFWEGKIPVSDLRFSPDGRTLLVAAGKQVRLLDIATAALVAEFPMKHSIHGAAYSPDGERIAVANNRFLTLLDVATGASVEWKKHAQVLSAEFNSDGQTLVLGCLKGCAHVVDAATGEPRGPDLIGHIAEASYAVFSPDDARIVTASRDSTARIWDAKTGELLYVLPHAHWIRDAVFSPDGQRVLTASSDHTLFVWDIFPEPRITSRMEHRGDVQRARFSPDGRSIASAGMDLTVRFWNVRTGKPAAPTINMSMPPLNAAYSPEGRRLATAGQGGHVAIWDLSGEPALNVGRGIVSADGERYVTFASNSFRVFDARNDAAVTPLLSVSQEIASVSCSADARTILITGNRDTNGLVPASVYDAGARGPRPFTSLVAGEITLLSPDGAMLLRTKSGVAGIWNIATGAVLFRSDEVSSRFRCAAFSPDSRTLAFGCDTNVFVVDAQTGVPRFQPLPHPFRIGALSFSRGSSQLVSATADSDYNIGMAFVWDARTGRPLAHNTLHTDGIVTAKFTSDGKSIATGGDDSRAFLWDAVTGRPHTEPLTLSWQVRSVNFSADDRWLVASSWCETQLWEAGTGQALTPVFRLAGPGRFEESGFCAGTRRIWIRSSRALLFWNLPRVDNEPNEILAMASHLGVTIPTGVRGGSAAWPVPKLRALCAEERARVESTLAAWHSQQAQVFENEGDWFAAQFHLQQLLKLASSDQALLTRLEIARSRRPQLNSPSVTNAVAHP
ncbi:MAG TPA: protein kinase [Methylomirabilota bacterium]|nr:protein kinase [Methylomirabilota bacterium]